MAKRSQRLRRQRRIEQMKAKEQEAKMTKVVEDNSIILDRMNNVSSICDNILQTFDTTFEALAETKNNETTKTEREPLKAPEFLKNMGTGRKPPTKSKENREPLSAPEFLKNMGSNKTTATNTETKGTPLETPPMLKMLKKDLLKMAKDKGCEVAPSMTKVNIIKAIEAKQ